VIDVSDKLSSKLPLLRQARSYHPSFRASLHWLRTGLGKCQLISSAAVSNATNADGCHAKVAKLQRASLRDPVKVEVCNKYQTVDKLLQFYLFIPAREKVSC